MSNLIEKRDLKTEEEEEEIVLPRALLTKGEKGNDKENFRKKSQASLQDGKSKKEIVDSFGAEYVIVPCASVKELFYSRHARPEKKGSIREEGRETRYRWGREKRHVYLAEKVLGCSKEWARGVKWSSSRSQRRGKTEKESQRGTKKRMEAQRDQKRPRTRNGAVGSERLG